MIAIDDKRLKLAIVGRPNVGKSALFNCICKKRIAIVDEAEGVTRDRIYAESDLFGMPFVVVDTGGINSRDPGEYSDHIRSQAEIAIREADAIVMVVDARIGVTDLDLDLVKLLHRTDKPVTLAVNKLDNNDDDAAMHDFHCLGIERMIPTSATQRRNIAELLEMAFEGAEAKKTDNQPPPQTIGVAIVGRPNVGKSSLVNFLLQEERCIVSPIPGTTRDSIDVAFNYGGQSYNLIDTAGIRRKNAEHEVVDKFAAIRSQRAIDRADVCLLMIDAREGITTRDKKIANMIEESKKGCILLLNKWDLVKNFRMEHCLRGIWEEVPFLRHCPTLCMSAKTGRNVEKIFPFILNVDAACRQRVGTHELNTFIERAMQVTPPPRIMGKRLRVYYMTQVTVQPPTFVMFINYPNLMTGSYKRYLYNRFREKYPFLGAPVIFHLKRRSRKDLNVTN